MLTTFRRAVIFVYVSGSPGSWVPKPLLLSSAAREKLKHFLQKSAPHKRAPHATRFNHFQYQKKKAKKKRNFFVLVAGCMIFFSLRFENK